MVKKCVCVCVSVCLYVFVCAGVCVCMRMFVRRGGRSWSCCLRRFGYVTRHWLPSFGFLGLARCIRRRFDRAIGSVVFSSHMARTGPNQAQLGAGVFSFVQVDNVSARVEKCNM